jgi:hypothetical protein
MNIGNGIRAQATVSESLKAAVVFLLEIFFIFFLPV